VNGERGLHLNRAPVSRFPLTAHRLPLTLFVLLLLVPGRLWAQGESLTRAFDLERRGNFAQAADLYRSVLATKPGEVAALLGLERSLVPLNRLRRFSLRSAQRSQPIPPPLRSMALLSAPTPRPTSSTAWNRPSNSGPR
jgi:hypothetical protein